MPGSYHKKIMTGRELIRKTFRLESVPRIPWIPFVGIHGGNLIGVSAKEYLKSSDNIVSGIDKAIELYKPDGIPVTFDLQIEAEALGCKMAWSDQNPPAVISHPLSGGKTLGDMKIPGPEDGRIGLVLEAARRIREKYPDLSLYGLVTGPFTLALHLLGTDIFVRMFEDEKGIKELMDFTKEVGRAMAQYYLESGCDVIAIVDPMTSQIGPDQFRQFITSPISDLFAFIRKNKGLGSFFVCGYAQQNIEAMCECQPDNISIDENIPLDWVRDICLERRISFGGNLKLTVVLLMGSPEDCKRHALECIDLGGNIGYILSPGCDLPLYTPVENLKAVSAMVHDTYSRDVVRAIQKKPDEILLPDMKDYGKADKVIVDIITLDSESCAPCQYMVESVKTVAPEFEGIVEWREHSIKKLDAVNFMSALLVKNIPTICIDGKIAFVSKIPPRNELIRAIQERINEKLRLRIRMKKGEVLILGRTRDECKPLENKLKEVITELGPTVSYRIVTDKNEIMSYGVVQTPSIIVASYKTKSQGSDPSIEILKEWVKEIL
jgi:MtaA/CmuA family methyltransferase